MWYIFIVLFGDFDFTRIEVDNGGHCYHGVWAADINDDGKIDILAGRQATDAGAIWYEQTADINTWIFHWINSSLSNVTDIASGDFDGDGDKDIICNNIFANEIYIGENDGSGGFTNYLISTSVSGPRGIIPADVDNDDTLDFVVGSGSVAATYIYWFKNNGGLSFTPFQVGTISFSEPAKIDVFDADGDGHMEIIVSAKGDGTVYLFQNDGSESFTHILVDGSITEPAGIGVGDFNGDGLWDAAVCEFTNGGMVLWYENTGGAFNEHMIENGVNNCDGLNVGDIDLDGDLDVVVCNYNNTAVKDGSIRLYENDGGGKWTPWVIDSTNIVNGDLPFIVDIDQDDCPDIIMSDNYPGAYITLYHQKCKSGAEEVTLNTELSCKVFPTPATHKVNFTLSVPQAGRYELNIYNITGRLVYKCIKTLKAGTHLLTWDTRDIKGNSVVSGVYFYQLKLNHQEARGRFIITR